jgi:hypothetical protein
VRIWPLHLEAIVLKTTLTVARVPSGPRYRTRSSRRGSLLGAAGAAAGGGVEGALEEEEEEKALGRRGE